MLITSRTRLIMLFSLPAALTALVFSPRQSAGDETPLICCGGPEVFVIDPERPDRKLWTWQASDSPEIPASMQQQFQTTDDCKPYLGDQLLITSSSSGVALVERTSKRCLFLATARNAHSACLLPGHEVAVASSFGGDALLIFDLNDTRRPAVAKRSIPLLGAHGAVWNAKQSCLWALGSETLVRIEAGESTRGMEWRIVDSWDLPSRGGHDLWPLPSADSLFITTDSQVLLFDLSKPQFRQHPELGAIPRVKSVSMHPGNRAIVYHQATPQNWWSDLIRFSSRDDIQLPGERLYKVRWGHSGGKTLVLCHRQKFGLSRSLENGVRYGKCKAPREPFRFWVPDPVFPGHVR